MDIRIGVPGIAEDGAAGRRERGVLDPATHAGGGAGAVRGGRLPRRVVIPSERLLGAGARGLRGRGGGAPLARPPPRAGAVGGDGLARGRGVRGNVRGSHTDRRGTARRARGRVGRPPPIRRGGSTCPPPRRTPSAPSSGPSRSRLR